MLPEILGVAVPEAYLAGAPPVNKLTLLKSNKDLQEKDEEKTTGNKNGDEEEKMDTQSGHKTKQKDRKKNQRGKSAQMEVEVKYKDNGKIKGITEDSGGKMEISKRCSTSRNKHEREGSFMDVSQSNNN